MRLLSSRVIGYAADIAKATMSEGELGILFMQAGLDDFRPPKWYGKAQLLATTLRTARLHATDADMEARQALYDFVQLLAERIAPRDDPDDIAPGTPFRKLREVVRSDGLDLHVDYESTMDTWGTTSYRLVEVRLLPLDEPAAPLTREITAVEDDLIQLGMNTAQNCYRQAVDSLTDNRFEAANGQLRSTLEAVIAHFAASRGFESTRQGDGGAALVYLIDSGGLPKRDGGEFVHGLWTMTHTNGPHPGTSNAGEAYFRLQAVTSAIRFLIDRFS